MKYNLISDTDIRVSEICLGTMTFGEQNTEKEGHEQMDMAIDMGVNFFDTAEMYAVPSTKENNGKTEEIIGTWFHQSGKRDKVILATKVTGPSPNLEKYVAKNLGFSKPRIHEALERSLLRMKTDYIDVYQLHWPERKTNMFGQRGFRYDVNEEWKDNIQEVVYTLNELIKEGKIRTYGLSNETPWGVMRYLKEADNAQLARPVTIQNPYGLLNRTYEIGMSEISTRENIGLLSYSPMAFGLLSGKYHRGLDTEKDRRNKFKQMSRYDSPQSYDATSLYLKIADHYEISLAQLSLAFVNSRPFVTSTIIGATNLAQLKENIESSNVQLSNEIFTEIEQVHELIPNPAP
ncbi:MAG: aldo/keto reductase [Saprospiraceae bacterium]|nr:aldo/keto reductase [Saprospiraceae bacterium]